MMIFLKKNIFCRLWKNEKKKKTIRVYFSSHMKNEVIKYFKNSYRWYDSITFYHHICMYVCRHVFITWMRLSQLTQTSHTKHHFFNTIKTHTQKKMIMSQYSTQKTIWQEMTLISIVILFFNELTTRNYSQVAFSMIINPGLLSCHISEWQVGLIKNCWQLKCS